MLGQVGTKNQRSNESKGEEGGGRREEGGGRREEGGGRREEGYNFLNTSWYSATSFGKLTSAGR